MHYNKVWCLILAFLHFLQALSDNQECGDRYRKSWYSLTEEEQLLYITGFQEIRKNGALSTITASYSKSIQQSIDTSSFFFIHQHFVYEAENAIRSLGGSYSCFSMAYWDFSMDASLEHDAPIFKTGLGDINCLETETDSMCCLNRSLSTTRTLPSSIEIAYAIQSNTEFEAFTKAIKRFNDYVHAFIGSNDLCPMSNTMFLLSSFIGYIGFIWSDCNDYDLNGISELNIVYDLGSFWSLSKLNTWCEGHINNELFVHKDISYTKTRLNQYIDKTWNALDQRGMSNDDKLFALSALSCDYIRRESLNSCFDEDILKRNDEGMCNDLSVEELEALSLNDLYGYIGNDNECLLRIRQDSWSYIKDNIILKQSVCNGEFDYKCNVWIDDGYDGYDDISGILSQDSSETNNIYPSSSRDFLTFDTSLWSVIVWCSMFIFIFMMCCYMFTVKKDYEIETMYKKHRKTAHVAIYGAVGLV